METTSNHKFWLLKPHRNFSEMCQRNCPTAYHHPKGKALGRRASRTGRAGGRGPQMQLETNFAPNSLATGFCLVNPELGSGTTEHAVAKDPLSRQSFKFLWRRDWQTRVA